jgi:hypothetical protein
MFVMRLLNYGTLWKQQPAVTRNREHDAWLAPIHFEG